MFMFKVLNNYQLPPKEGFVEDEDESGQRVYRPIETIASLIIKDLQDQLAAAQTTILSTTQNFSDFMDYIFTSLPDLP